MSQVSTIAQTIRDLLAHIKSRGGRYSDWYCGIAAEPRHRLFVDHQVSEENGHWMYRSCATDDDAREVEAYFHELGCKGAGGGGDRHTRYVHAYRITSDTREDV
jgi:hypothetical protein